MKIKLHSHCYINIIFIIFLSVLFSACGGSGSEKSRDNSDGNVKKQHTEQKVKTIQGVDVETILEEAKITVSQGATITIYCKCGNRAVRGQGADEDTAKTKAQKLCSTISSGALSISECEPMTATPSST